MKRYLTAHAHFAYSYSKHIVPQYSQVLQCTVCTNGVWRGGCMFCERLYSSTAHARPPHSQRTSRVASVDRLLIEILCYHHGVACGTTLVVGYVMGRVHVLMLVNRHNIFISSFNLWCYIAASVRSPTGSRNGKKKLFGKP